MASARSSPCARDVARVCARACLLACVRVRVQGLVDLGTFEAIGAKFDAVDIARTGMLTPADMYIERVFSNLDVDAR